jgi:polysaccharide export outer membrane protein
MKRILAILALGLSVLQASPIESGQAIQITVQGVPPSEAARLNGTYPVSDSGYIRMWQVGTIRAAGIDSSVLGQRIEAAYKAAEIYTDPTFQVLSDSSDAIKQQMVTVGGKVRQPGQKPYQKGMKLFQAVAAAGGATEFGAVNRVRLYRNKKVFTYDLTRAEHKTLLIYPNDIIDIPAKNWIGK